MPAFSVIFCWTGEVELAGLAIQGLYDPGGRCAVALIVKFLDYLLLLLAILWNWAIFSTRKLPVPACSDVQLISE